jgi:hypothetical protein
MTCSNPESQKIPGIEPEYSLKRCLGEESGAGRIDAPDLYRVRGSLPIPNHTTQGVTASIGGVGSGLGRSSRNEVERR